MRNLIAGSLLGLCMLGWCWQTPAAADDNTPMVRAARDWVASLTAEQRQSALRPFESSVRYGWHVVPKAREGVSVEMMTPAQRALVLDLLHTSLSEAGYAKATAIMELENVLRLVESRPQDDRYRHPELYYMLVFGEPGSRAPWGWRFEGHHLSLSFTVAQGQVAVTPAFMGANPAEVRTGEKQGTRVLRAEEEMARALLGMLDETQLRQAVIAPAAPAEVLTLATQVVSGVPEAGIWARDMTPDQQQALRQLIRTYTHNMSPALAEAQWARIEAAGFEQLRFAWAGSLERGQAHYYRVQGPVTLIEYDNTQNNGNHQHTLWRDPAGDFGEDLLRTHLETDHRH
ncbi:MAG: DUF3500 domain-containing protein [Bacteroidia bacterium]|nr:DUF3500 domain-containing protein [Bacteroidia bacterium]